MEIIGFLYKGILPNGLVTVLKKEGVFYSVYPDGNVYTLTSTGTDKPCTQEEILRRPKFIQRHQACLTQDPTDYTSYGFSMDEIIVGSIPDIRKRLTEECDNPRRSAEEKEYISTYLKSTPPNDVIPHPHFSEALTPPEPNQ